MNTYKNVTINDKFKIKGIIYKVIDFYITKNNNNEIVNSVCLCEHKYLNQVIRSEKPFSMVIRYKI